MNEVARFLHSKMMAMYSFQNESTRTMPKKTTGRYSMGVASLRGHPICVWRTDRHLHLKVPHVSSKQPARIFTGNYRTTWIWERPEITAKDHRRMMLATREIRQPPPYMRDIAYRRV